MTNAPFDYLSATNFYVRGRDDDSDAWLTRVHVGLHRFDSTFLRLKSALSAEECAAVVEQSGMDYANANPHFSECVFGR